MVLYMAILMLFRFYGRRKNEKRCGGEVGRRDDGRGCWRGAGARARDGGGMLEAVQAAAVVQRQSKFVIAPLLRRWRAAVWAIFAPLRLCTGGGGGSGARDGEAGGRRQGARREGWRRRLAGDTPLLSDMVGTICRFG